MGREENKQNQKTGHGCDVVGIPDKEFGEIGQFKEDA